MFHWLPELGSRRIRVIWNFWGSGSGVGYDVGRGGRAGGGASGSVVGVGRDGKGGGGPPEKSLPGSIYELRSATALLGNIRSPRPNPLLLSKSGAPKSPHPPKPAFGLLTSSLRVILPRPAAAGKAVHLLFLAPSPASPLSISFSAPTPASTLHILACCGRGPSKGFRAPFPSSSELNRICSPLTAFLLTCVPPPSPGAGG